MARVARARAVAENDAGPSVRQLELEQEVARLRHKLAKAAVAAEEPQVREQELKLELQILKRILGQENLRNLEERTR
jgi:hypothetical protein